MSVSLSIQVAPSMKSRTYNLAVESPDTQNDWMEWLAASIAAAPAPYVYYIL